ncbi:outer membrane beta-barrel protein [Bradyrhizobium sp.]|uniref:outer membrane protein n=1 Tax=Bradyrhizobium sp. TaxID=376 RepID=UPI001EB4E92D|nr:outer membrane beta-barrel protein [Bradyrhizobium sp.]MBV9981075.1 porin family protein [Bradyrhizobium sp.]
MRCFLLALGAAVTAAAVGGLTSASAADLPEAMPAKAPMMMAPAYDWSGFYIGGHVGGVWDHRTVTTNNIATGVAVPLGTGTGNLGSVTGGAQAGFNFVLAPGWVAGLEADVSGAGLDGTTIVTATRFGTDQHHNELDLYGTVRGRVGYAVNNVLLYGTGGFAWADEKITRTQVTGVFANAVAPVSETATQIGVGWAAGAGVEWGFAPNWSARAEYLHLDLGTQSFTFPLAMQRNDAKVNLDVVRAGVNYKFGGW